MADIREKDGENRLIIRTVSDGGDWYRIKYQLVKLQSGGERIVSDKLSFVQAWDAEEAIRVLKDVLRKAWEETAAIADSYKEPIIVSLVQSDAECFINKSVQYPNVPECTNSGTVKKYPKPKPGVVDIYPANE